jgi:AcrR family transcriptional regulator
MVEESRRDAPNRTTLTPRAVVEGALALADAEGLEAVTIRRLAKRLGVTPMALYWHFHSKDELLEGVAASIFEEVDLLRGRPSRNRGRAGHPQARGVLAGGSDADRPPRAQHRR